MRRREIRLRKLKLRLRDKRFVNHKAPCTVIWQQPLQLVLALRGCSATELILMQISKCSMHITFWSKTFKIILYNFQDMCIVSIHYFGHYMSFGDERWLGFPDLWSGQKPWWNWYLTPVVNFGEVRRAQLAKSTLLTFTLVPLGSFQIF